MTLRQMIPLVFASTPICLWIGNALLRQHRLHWVFAFFLTCLSTYVVLVVGVRIMDALLVREMYTFDLDGDGSFSDFEMTPDAERAMDAVTSDTGRNFAPITGIPITFIWVSLCLIACSVLEWIAKLVCRTRTPLLPGPPSAASIDSQSAAAAIASETGNPYQPPPSN